MIGSIFIDSLALETTIGLHSWEKTVKQTVVADIEIGIDYSMAAETDHIDHSVNYETIANDLHAWAADHRCELLETLAKKIIARIGQTHTKLRFIAVKLSKHGVVPHTKSCGVTLRVDYDDN